MQTGPTLTTIDLIWDPPLRLPLDAPATQIWGKLGEALALIKHMQDFLAERGLCADYMDWTLQRHAE